MATNPKPLRKKLAKDAKKVRGFEKKETPNKAIRKAKDRVFMKAHEKVLAKTKSGKLKTGGYR